MSPAHYPKRLCIGCREVAPQCDLMRLVLDRSNEPPAVEIDEHRSAPGRGAWVHPHPQCIAQTTLSVIKRALRIAEPVDMTKVTTWFG